MELCPGRRLAVKARSEGRRAERGGGEKETLAGDRPSGPGSSTLGIGFLLYDQREVLRKGAVFGLTFVLREARILKE